MKIINKVNITQYDPNKLYNKINKYVANEINSLNTPCYTSRIVNIMDEIMFETKLTRDMVIDFKKIYISDEYSRAALVFNDKNTLMLIMLILDSYDKNLDNLAHMFLNVLTIKLYVGRFKKLFPKFCNPEIWDQTFEYLSHLHNFKTKSGISNTVTYFIDEEIKRSKLILKNTSKRSDEYIFYMVYRLASRISQSLKSFAGKYYDLVDKKIKNVGKDQDEDSINDIFTIINKVTTLMTTYGNIDNNLKSIAINEIHIDPSIANKLIEETSNSDNYIKLKFILIILFKQINNYKDVQTSMGRNKIIKFVNKKIKYNNQYSVYNKTEDMISELPSAYIFNNNNMMQNVDFYLRYVLLYIAKYI